MIVQKNNSKGGEFMDREMLPPITPVMDQGLKLARAYVPFQVMGRVYEPAEALKRGTLFPELFMPYMPGSHN